MTLLELKEALASSYDEVTLLELLNINTYDLINKFSDEIEEDQERLEQELNGITTEAGDVY
jgi:division protein CdvB (Snf7/Vps24/ESCRT-III family)